MKSAKDILAPKKKENTTATTSGNSKCSTKELAYQNPNPLDPSSFPDTTLRGQGTVNVQQTIPNIEHMLQAYCIVIKYCAITKKVEINIPDLRGDPANIANTALTSIISLAKLNNMGTDQVPSYLAAIADYNQTNPVADWMFSKAWDGVDRLCNLYETLCVAADYPIDLRNILVRRWLLSAVAAALKPSGFRARGVLTLQGPQSIGKTSWLLSLVPDALLREKVVLIDHLLDVGNKDSILLAVSHWLVELGELESSFKRDQAKLKGFITSNVDKIRPPYARLASEFSRRTVFFATVNDPQFLVDQTGNTRFWTIPVTKIQYEHSIDMQQLWAQVAHIFKHDQEQWWLTPDEERQLEAHNKQHRAVSAIRDLLESSLDFDAPLEKRTMMSASSVLKEIGIQNPSNVQAKECGQFLRELYGDPRKSQGAMRWLVPPSIDHSTRFTL